MRIVDLLTSLVIDDPIQRLFAAAINAS